MIAVEGGFEEFEEIPVKKHQFKSILIFIFGGPNKIFNFFRILSTVVAFQEKIKYNYFDWLVLFEKNTTFFSIINEQKMDRWNKSGDYQNI